MLSAVAVASSPLTISELCHLASLTLEESTTVWKTFDYASGFVRLRPRVFREELPSCDSNDPVSGQTTVEVCHESIRAWMLNQSAAGLVCIAFFLEFLHSPTSVLLQVTFYQLFDLTVRCG
jgi:hypothetical protein